MPSEGLQRRILTKLYTRLTSDDVTLIISTMKVMGVDATILDESKFVYCMTSLGSVIDDIREIELGGGRLSLEQKTAIKSLILKARMRK